ncbi:hypothetical protein EDD37DRAFT_672390 [Exophiala viscosa]|uniref:uncharacterized protein n=1 Tax=Exophiala viscosa TaxID=2486360 RepID=UPI0021916538|nr:hypothetical protein EDD37DRAFT_672390 [Exophiala viscosa]
MPPREDGTPRAFTWITGDPRSRQNVTQIRRHAGQNPGNRVVNSLRASADNNQASSVHGRVYLAPTPIAPVQLQGTAGTSTPNETPSTSSAHVVYPTTRPPDTTTPASTGSVQVLYPGTRPPERRTSALVTTKESVRRLAIDDLVNHSDEQDKEYTLISSAPDTAGDVVGLLPDKPVASADVLPGPPATRGCHEKSEESLRRAGHRHTPSKHFQASKTSAIVLLLDILASGPLLIMSTDDSQMEHTLLRTSAFYNGTFERIWSQRLQVDSAAFDIISTIETFSGSITTAAGLIAVNRIDSASSILNRVLPTVHQLLASPHPQLYYVLAELSLDASDSHLAGLRFQIKHFAADESEGMLGATHPITQLLRTRLTNKMALRLREFIQAEIHTLHEQSFSMHAYQTTCHEYFLARILSQLGRRDDAIRTLSGLTTRWESTYGADSLMCVTAMLELAKVYLSNRRGLDAETLADDALQRTFRIQTSSHQRPLSAGKLHSRMACLRTLGRVHSLRDNHGSALQYYTRAVKVGVDELGSAVPATQLALADLDAASKMASQADSSMPGVLGPRIRADEKRELLGNLTSINTTAVS